MGGKTNARIPESAHKERPTTPGAILITHNHVNAAQRAHTHTQHTRGHVPPSPHSPQSRLTHTYRLCQEGPLGPVMAGASGGLIRLAGLVQSCCCCCCRRGREIYHRMAGSGKGSKGRRREAQRLALSTLRRMEPSNRLHLLASFPAAAQPFFFGFFSRRLTWRTLDPQRRGGGHS